MSPPFAEVQNVIRQIPTSTSPLEVVLDATDAPRAYIKPILTDTPNTRNFAQINRSIIADWLTGCLGAAASAPVARVELVNLPQYLVDHDPNLAGCVAGSTYASIALDNVDDLAPITTLGEPLNEERFGRLAVLYGWIGCQWDPQWVYNLDPPPLIWSVDHGWLLPGSQNWDVATLTALTPYVPDPGTLQAVPDAAAFVDAGETAVRAVSDATIQEAVDKMPVTWPVTDAERIALVEYLTARRDSL